MTVPQQPPWGYPPPPPPPAWVLPKEAYTPWATRLCAFLIDVLPAVIAFVIGSMIGDVASDCVAGRPGTPQPGYCGWTASEHGETLALLAFGLSFAVWLSTLAYLIWNLGYRQGKTGSSIGKSVLKFKVVSEKTWQPIGFGMSLVRQLVHWVDQMACYVGFLWPLWDKKRQTFADMIMSTVCVPRDAPPPQMPYQPAGYPWPG